jgi:probable phosphoglycerate mutase
MKLPRYPLFWLLPLVVLVLGSNCGRLTQTQQHERRATIVYILRHAEKDQTPGLADPPLAPAGQQRAVALREKIFKQARPSAIFTTNTTRTHATVAPLAELLKVTPQVYDARQLPALAARIRREYRDRVVVVVGHSNTVLETVEALGAQRPIEAIKDDEHGYLFKVSVPLDSTRAATAETQSY